MSQPMYLLRGFSSFLHHSEPFKSSYSVWKMRSYGSPLALLHAAPRLAETGALSLVEFSWFCWSSTVGYIQIVPNSSSFKLPIVPRCKQLCSVTGKLLKPVSGMFCKDGVFATSKVLCLCQQKTCSLLGEKRHDCLWLCDPLCLISHSCVEIPMHNCTSVGTSCPSTTIS